MFRLLKVRGQSLTPVFQEDDYVLILRASFPGLRIKTGDVIVFDQPPYGRLIKQVRQVLDSGESFAVRGSQISSTDSRNFGPVSRICILGKVIWHIKPKRNKKGQPRVREQTFYYS